MRFSLKQRVVKNIDIKRVKELLIELEKIRLDLEFKDYKVVSKDEAKRLTK